MGFFQERMAKSVERQPNNAWDILSQSKDIIHNACDSFVYSAIQSPVNGLVQLVGGDKCLPNVQLVEAPKPAEFASANWYAQQLGGGLGTTVPFLLARGATRAAARLVCPSLAAENIALLATSTQRPSYMVAEAALSGFVYDGLLRPVSIEEGNFWLARLKNATIGGVTFAGLAKITHGLHVRSGCQALKPDLAINAAAGGLAGMANAELSSLLNGRGHAKLKDLQESAWSFMVTGGALGLLHRANQHKESQFVSDQVRELSSRPDLRRVRWQHDGTRVFAYADDSTISLLEDGTTVARFDEGGVVQTKTAEGVVVEHYPNGACYKQFPDGVEMSFQPNGNKVTRMPNGDKVVSSLADDSLMKSLRGDGCRREVLFSGIDVTMDPNGEKQQTRFSGGETWVLGLDGSRTRQFPDGSSATRLHDGTRIDQKTIDLDQQWFGRETFGIDAKWEPNGDKTISFSDGVSYTRLTDGRVIRREFGVRPQVWFADGGKMLDQSEGGLRSKTRDDGSVFFQDDHYIAEDLTCGLSASEGIYPQSLWSKAVRFPNGEIARLNVERGERSIEHPNGQVDTTYFDGTRTIDQANGDKAIVRPDGLVYESLADGLSIVRDCQGKLISWANGIEQVTFAGDGTETRRSLREYLPDSLSGAFKFADPEGKGGYGVLYSDGTVVAVKPEHTTVFKPDGTRITQYWDWSLRQHTPLTEKDPTGIEPIENALQMRIARVDGSETVSYNNGYKKTKYPGNMGLVEHTDGSKDIYFPDGERISLNKADSIDVCSYPSGMVATKIVLSDRTISQYRTSGMRLTEISDGTTILQYPHGVTITFRSDSTQVYEYKQGEYASVTVLPGGTRIIVCRQGTYPAGTVIMREIDGSESIQLPQGFYADRFN